jgi:DNA-directed RNA polymerase specialized sigma24 family protein
MQRHSDAQLIAAVRAGDRSAFEAIYRAYRPRLLAFARRHGELSPQNAHEAVQDVFLTLWTSRAGWHPPSGIKPYLFAALRRRVGLPTPRKVDNHRDASIPYLAGLEAAITAIVDAMPARYRDVYRLRHIEGLDAETVADVLGVSMPTVKRRHARALHLLVRGLAATEWSHIAHRPH